MALDAAKHYMSYFSLTFLLFPHELLIKIIFNSTEPVHLYKFLMRMFVIVSENKELMKSIFPLALEFQEFLKLKVK